MYAADNKPNKLSPEGYWVQFDEDNDAGKGKVQAVVHSYFTKNEEHGKKGTLELEIAVPIMQIEQNKIVPSATHCDICGSGEVDGFKYDYKNSNSNFMQGLIFAGNSQPQKGSSEKSSDSEMYDEGGVLNPKDGKTYNSQAQIQDNGETMFVRAYKGSSSGFFSFGKKAHWKRISKQKYLEFKKKCGYDSSDKDSVKHAPFVNSEGKLVNKKLFEECCNYDFNVTKPVN